MANLRSVMWHLRRQNIAILTHDRAGLWLEGVAIDIDVLRNVASRLMRFPDEAEFGEEEVELVLLGGELLPGWSDEWLDAPREYYRQLRLHALEAMCSWFARARQFGPAIQACLTAVAAEPLRDTGHRELIRVYLSEGNRSEALRQYQVYRSLMFEELGLGPSPDITALMKGLWLAGDQRDRPTGTR
jgi:DNA-binding SARP family transcriptional activator